MNSVKSVVAAAVSALALAASFIGPGYAGQLVMDDAARIALTPPATPSSGMPSMSAGMLGMPPSPNPPRGGVFHTDIHITTFAPPPPAVAYAQQETPAYPGTQYSANQAPTSAPQTSTASTELIRHINHAVQTGQMSPAVAVQLLANLAPKAPPQWEILETDQTLQNTFVRWGKTANWEVKWQNVPDIKNPGHVVLPDGDFLTTASGVLKQAQKATQAAGFDLDIIAYPNRVLVISKANIK